MCWIKTPLTPGIGQKDKHKKLNSESSSPKPSTPEERAVDGYDSSSGFCFAAHAADSLREMDNL